MYVWGHHRRFNSYAQYIRKIFGARVQKLSIDAGFSCPNRDGTIATGGCIFCNSDAFNPSYCAPEKDIRQQLDEGIDFHRKRYRRNQGYLAYFQAYSNTHAPIETLRTLYEQALEHPSVVGLIIGTRPDCVDSQKLDYLAELSRRTYVAIEYGIESCNDDTLRLINRGHTFKQSVWALEESQKRGLTTGAHIILGLPGESRKMMLEQTSIISGLPFTTLKLHQFQVIRSTAFERVFNERPENYPLFELPEYIDFVIDYIERLNPLIIIERFTAEVPPRFLVAPDWGLVRADQILNLIEKHLEERNTWQGRLYAL